MADAGEERSEPVIKFQGWDDGTVAIEVHRAVPRIIAAQALIEAGNNLLNDIINEAKSAADEVADLLRLLITGAEPPGPDA